MITNNPTSGLGATPGPEPRRTRGHATPVSQERTESLSTDRANSLREALSRTPEVRLEVVSRAKTLAIDPNYPPLEIIERVASQIAAAQDLSEVTE